MPHWCHSANGLAGVLANELGISAAQSMRLHELGHSSRVHPVGATSKNEDRLCLDG